MQWPKKYVRAEAPSSLSHRSGKAGCMDWVLPIPMVTDGFVSIWTHPQIKTTTNNTSIMKRNKFSVAIDAPSKQVWDVLLNMESYYQYTAPVCEGSSVITSWKEGTQVKFLDASGQVTLVKIVRNQPPYRMWIEVVGVIHQDGRTDT